MPSSVYLIMIRIGVCIGIVKQHSTTDPALPDHRKHQPCLTIQKNATTGRTLYGRSGEPFCNFLETCLSVQCPLVSVSGMGISDLHPDEAQMLPDGTAEACKLSASDACKQAYLGAKVACAGDEYSKEVWLGRRTGACAKCQCWVAVYRHLRDGGCTEFQALDDCFAEL